MSAAYKYAAFQTFCIPTEGDNDTENTTHEVEPRYQKAKEATKPATPAAPVDPADQAYHDRIKAALKAIYGDDKNAALAKVEELTTFTPKGKTESVKGIRNYLTLKGTRAEILAKNLEKLVVQKNTVTCSLCGNKLTEDGHCPKPSCEANTDKIPGDSQTACPVCGAKSNAGVCSDPACSTNDAPF